MYLRASILAFALAVLAGGVAFGCEPTQVASWDFGTEESTPLQMHGSVQRDQAGPRPPEFPDFPEDNTAVRFAGKGYFTVPDPGIASEFDFENGDEITLEAWVKLDEARDGRLMYVICKGRSGSPKFARDNQNWAMRVVSQGGTVKTSFLFATRPRPGREHWHRWTTTTGFKKSTGWHHIAVAYRFGDPGSIRGWIDGKVSAGTWDMGGATEEPPVVDNDDVWIGSAQRGNAGNSLQGFLDAVAIHRTVLADKVISSRFNRVGGPRVVAPQREVMRILKNLESGRVLVTCAEGLPSANRWPLVGEAWPAETGRWLTNEFLTHRLPARFDGWGIRAAWKAPLLVRMAGDVSLPEGKHRFLVRARSLSRLWVDGKVVVRTRSARKRTGNLEPIVRVPKERVPGERVAGFVQQEAVGEYEIGETGGLLKSVRVVLEFVVGGPGLRTETGEVCVAVQPDGEEWFGILRPPGSAPLPLIDVAVERTLKDVEKSLIAYEDETRRKASESKDAFWKMRHQVARKYATQQSPAGAEDPSPIDSFIRGKIDRAEAESAKHGAATTRDFHGKVLPILREHCFRCHGEKSRGGLRLDSREHLLSSGDSELPAVVPGDPQASQMLVRIRDGEMPPNGVSLSKEQSAVLEEWVAAGAVWPSLPIDARAVAQPPVIGDSAFLRRVFLDSIGMPPRREDVVSFLRDPDSQKRKRIIDRLLDDERYAGHWISLWLDLLAENPTLLNASLNSTGPFRWFLHDSLRDHKAIDRMVTELILMRGSASDGGSAGFGLAAENDSPMAAKGHILASAFLGTELQCARCHDSPYHSTTQEDLYSLAAMLNRKPLAPPKTSRVPDEFFASKTRESLIRVSLELGKQVQPKWPFAEVTGCEDGEQIDALMMQPNDTRERLAALITSPRNHRFPQVVVNHLWKRLMGAGIVEPVNDWEGKTASHPQLLDWLAHEFILHDYDARHVMRLIMNSQAYQRGAVGTNLGASANRRFFNAPDPRRLAAEQIVDSLFAATGQSIDVEELTFVHDGSHPIGKRMTLGRPSRAWMFASLNNERDRPSLSLPRAQPVVDVLEAFGWTGSRQKPIPARDLEPNVLQPGILANGTLSKSLTRAAANSPLADLAVSAKSPDTLLNDLFLQFLSRPPLESERKALGTALADGFDDRLLPMTKGKPLAGGLATDAPVPQVTWTNHLVPEANEIQLEVQRRVRRGPPPDPRLRREWREVFEDVVWSLVNHREFVWSP